MRVEELANGVTLYLANAELVLAEMGCNSVDFIFTDPPYGHNNNDGDLIHMRETALGKGKPGAARKIENDGVGANDLVRRVFPQFNRILRRGCCCCCCCGGGGGPDPQFARWSLWIDEAIGFKQMVVWDKGPMGMGWHYRRSYETVLVAQKLGAACRWFDKTDRIENIVRPGVYGIRKILPAKDEHPTAKPVELAAHFIGLHTRVGDLVLDPFMGGGITGVAAIRLERKFIGVELDQHWFDYSCRRIDAELRKPGFFVNKPKRTKPKGFFYEPKRTRS